MVCVAVNQVDHSILIDNVFDCCVSASGQDVKEGVWIVNVKDQSWGVCRRDVLDIVLPCILEPLLFFSDL